METTKMEKNAEQEWKDKAEKDFDIGLIPASYLLGISGYKQALREAIEKEKVARGVHGHYADGRTWAFKRALELIETVTPSKDK